MLREEVFKILKKYKLSPRPDFDQNFLICDEVLLEILRHFRRKDIVFQVGLGLGTISFRIASRVEKLIVYEIDKRLIEIFRKEFGKKARRIEIYHADALRTSWPRFTKFFSSLPFSISDAIIRRLERKKFEEAVLIMPKTLFLKSESLYKLNFKFLMDVPKSCFYPEPDTEAVLSLVSR